MNESISISEKVRQQFSARATLVGLGVTLRKLKVLESVEQEVKIAQKRVKYTPLEKLRDSLVAILAGAQGLVARAVPNNRWCKIPWMPARCKM